MPVVIDQVEMVPESQPTAQGDATSQAPSPAVDQARTAELAREAMRNLHLRDHRRWSH